MELVMVNPNPCRVANGDAIIVKYMRYSEVLKDDVGRVHHIQPLAGDVSCASDANDGLVGANLGTTGREVELALDENNLGLIAGNSCAELGRSSNRNRRPSLTSDRGSSHRVVFGEALDIPRRKAECAEGRSRGHGGQSGEEGDDAVEPHGDNPGTWDELGEELLTRLSFKRLDGEPLNIRKAGGNLVNSLPSIQSRLEPRREVNPRLHGSRGNGKMIPSGEPCLSNIAFERGLDGSWKLARPGGLLCQAGIGEEESVSDWWNYGTRQEANAFWGTGLARSLRSSRATAQRVVAEMGITPGQTRTDDCQDRVKAGKRDR
jgi:hypothetical protein